MVLPDTRMPYNLCNKLVTLTLDREAASLSALSRLPLKLGVGFDDFLIVLKQIVELLG
jgi:hypothetical protein